jgi:hypothetical protein
MPRRSSRTDRDMIGALFDIVKAASDMTLGKNPMFDRTGHTPQP